jgi:hypothetical protein
MLIGAPLDRLQEDVTRMQACMAEASRIVLGGFDLAIDAHVVRYPDRYMDERGAVMWQRVMALVDWAEAGAEGVVALTTGCCCGDNTSAALPDSGT